MKSPIVIKMWEKERRKVGKTFLAKFGRKHPQIKQFPWKPNKTWIINSTSFLPLIYSPNGRLVLKFVESTVSEIIGGGGGGGKGEEENGTLRVLAEYLKNGSTDVLKTL